MQCNAPVSTPCRLPSHRCILNLPTLTPIPHLFSVRTSDTLCKHLNLLKIFCELPFFNTLAMSRITINHIYTLIIKCLRHASSVFRFPALVVFDYLAIPSFFSSVLPTRAPVAQLVASFSGCSLPHSLDYAVSSAPVFVLSIIVLFLPTAHAADLAAY